MEISVSTEKFEQTTDQLKGSYKGVYRSEVVASFFDDLENKYQVLDKTTQFAKLVNTSVSKNQPYHRWLRYREAYAGDLVKALVLVSDIDASNDVVLDPMCGSGSTMVACKELGISSIGLDVNPFSIDISMAKLNNYSDNALREIKTFLQDLVSTESDIALTGKYLDMLRYFNKSNLKQLYSIEQQIHNVSDESARKLLFAAWLSILEDCSNRKKDGNGLASRETSISDVYSRFSAQVESMIFDIENFKLPNIDSRALVASATESSGFVESIPNGKKLGSVIFSPPYANSFDYFESYKLELILGGYFTSETIGVGRKSLVRNYRIGHGKELTSKFSYVEYLCEEVWKAIPVKESNSGVRDGRTRLVPNMLRTYFEDMEKVLKQSFDALRSKGTVHIVIDQSSYIGVIIPTDLILAKIGEELGFNVVSISKCRKAATSGQQLSKFKYLKDMLRESIVTLQKP